MKLWFDDHLAAHLVFEKSLRCHLLRHETTDGSSCDGWFRSPGTGPGPCLCRCHCAAITRRATSTERPPLDLRQFVGGVTAAEACENLARALRGITP